MKQVRDNYSEEKVASGQHFCGKCGSLLSSRDSHCVQCHPRSKPQQVEQKRMQRSVEWKKETYALILSIILPGTGHIYIGQLVKGIGIIAVDVIAIISYPPIKNNINI